jgi:hypothetical protein
LYSDEDVDLVVKWGATYGILRVQKFNIVLLHCEVLRAIIPMGLYPHSLKIYVLFNRACLLKFLKFMGYSTRLVPTVFGNK